GPGRFAIEFGPGASSSITILMNEGGNSNTNTQWNYTAMVVNGTFNYLTFTENTNLAAIPIKFAPPPFNSFSFSTNFLLSGFEPRLTRSSSSDSPILARGRVYHSALMESHLPFRTWEEPIPVFVRRRLPMPMSVCSTTRS